MPIDFNNYIIKYKKIINEKEEELIQGILLPMSIKSLCDNISKKLKIKNKYLNINFDILDKLIKNKLIMGLEDKNCLIIENRENSIIVNTILKNQVVESYIINSNNNIIDYLKNLNKNNKILFYGLRNEIVKNSNFKELSIDDILTIYPIKENNINNLEYISTLGMLI